MNLLNALVRHYDVLAASGSVTPFGWTQTKAEFGVELNDDGEIEGIFALGNQNEKNSGEVFEVPAYKVRTRIPLPHLFCDTAEYILGNVSEKCEPAYYTSMKNAVLMFRDDLGSSPALNAAYKFYETWNPEKATENEFVSAALSCKDSESKTVILLYEGSPIFDDKTFRDSYTDIVETYGEMPIKSDSNGEITLTAAPQHMRSMVSGERGLKATLFRPITVRGKTTYLLSNNKVNTNYFGRKKGDAIPITMQDGHKIAEAAKNLVSSNHCFFIPVTSQSLYTKCEIVWSDDLSEEEEDAILSLCFNRSGKENLISVENESDADKASRIMRIASIRQGRLDTLTEEEKHLTVNVWNLNVPDKGCSASSFTQITLGDLLANYKKHYDDMEISRSQMCMDADGTSRDFARAKNIFASLCRKNKDGSTVAVNNQLWKLLSISIYSGNKYPEQILPLALNRVCKDIHTASNDKPYRIPASIAGIIKAILIRNFGEDISVGLNYNNTNPAYITGRIFAVMESAQMALNPTNQTTYSKRFFERVMTNPMKAMPEMHMSFTHLQNKAKSMSRMSTYVAFDKRIAELIDILDGNYPGRLTEKQKGEFLVGYYQQQSENIRIATEKKLAKSLENNPKTNIA